MNILSINQKYEISGGSDRYYFNMNDLLKKNGHNIIEFAASGALDQDSSYSNYFSSPVTIDKTNPFSLVRYLYNTESKSKLGTLLSDIDSVSLAHLQIYYGHVTSSILSILKKRNIPIVQTLHEYKFSCPVYTHVRANNLCEYCVKGNSINVVLNKCKNNSYIDSLVRYMEFNVSRIIGDVRNVDVFICVSEFQRDLMVRAGIPADKLRVLYNFVDVSAIDANFSHDGYLLYFGRLERLKGVHTLIEAMKFHPGLKLKIVGDGPYRKDLESLSRTLELGESIEFLGFKSDQELWDIVAKSMCIVVPSEWYENCSMTVLEAKAYSKPIIGASIGGITEQITEGVNGFLHEPGSVVALSEAIDRLLSLNQQEYVSLCKLSRSDLEERYSASSHYSQLLDIYNEVL